MVDVMRITKRYVYSEVARLAKETGIELYLEESSYRKKNSFTLHHTDENGATVKKLVEDKYTTREMYLALKVAREIYKAAFNQFCNEFKSTLEETEKHSKERKELLERLKSLLEERDELSQFRKIRRR